MKYTAKFWSKLLRKVDACYPRRYFDFSGQLQPYVHPWMVTMGVDRYNTLTPFFFPGGVNGYPPYSEMEYDKCPEIVKNRVAKDLTIDRQKPIRVYLDEGPTIPLRWRAFDPKNKDVKPTPFSQSPDSLIQATDIIIQTKRIALNLGVTKESSAELTGVQINPTYTPPSDHGFKISSTEKYVPPQSFLTSADIVAARFFDNPFEECKICTIYALSQDPKKTKPDMTWLFATTYNAYWNLLFFAPFAPKQNITNRLFFASPLAGGALQAAVILGQLFAANNEYTQAFTDFTTRMRLRGTYHSI